jgi:hypothetical protein
MKQNLAVSAIYMEMSRGFLNQEIIFDNQKGLNSINDIPELVKLNIKFSQFTGAIIFSISSLEGYINLKIFDILSNRFKLTKFKNQPNYNVIVNNINSFKNKYSDAIKMEKLFKDEILTKKVNMLFKCFGLKLLCGSSDKKDQKIWYNLERLQNIRNELVHPKPNFIESKEFSEFFLQTDEEFHETLLTPMMIRAKLFDDTPVLQINKSRNVILDKYMFKYLGDAIKEHILLTSSEYNIGNINKYKTRNI